MLPAPTPVGAKLMVVAVLGAWVMASVVEVIGAETVPTVVIGLGAFTIPLPALMETTVPTAPPDVM